MYNSAAKRLTNFVEYNGVDNDDEINYRPNEGGSNDK
jgi:hypothetical protein